MKGMAGLSGIDEFAESISKRQSGGCSFLLEMIGIDGRNPSMRSRLDGGCNLSVARQKWWWC